MPNRAQTRRDPLKGKNGFSRNKGFTFIELMIVIGVIAILTSLALPSYRTIIEKRQVTSGAEQISAFVSAVQFEAVKRGEPLAVRYMRTSADNWCLGVVPVEPGTTSNTPCDCTKGAGDAAACEVDGVLRVLQSGDLSYPNIMDRVDGDGAFAFDPVRGLLIEPAKSAEFELLSENAIYALHVQVTGTGRVAMCSETGKKVPGYDVCSVDL
jgi:prepilin-type N-terminal cleavage/methylation domain-containing protein